MQQTHFRVLGHTSKANLVKPEDFLMGALSPKFIYNIPQNDTQIENLVKKYLGESEQKKSLFIDVSKGVITSYFVLSAQSLLVFKPVIIDVELTNNKSLFIFANIDTYNIHFELFFESNNEVDAVINIYQSKKLLLATNGKFDQIIGKMKEYLEIPKITEYSKYVSNIDNNSNCIGNASSNELPENSLAEMYI